MEPKDRLIFALDAPGLAAAEKWVERLKGSIGMFKVGAQLYTREGPAAVKLVTGRGAKAFLDLKFHDIPFTVGEAAAEAAAMGVSMFTVHAAGGKAMIRSAVNWSRESAEKTGNVPPKVLAVTVLTSLTDRDLEEMGVISLVQEQALRMAGLALKAGADGVVASPQEVDALRKEFGKKFLIVTPGIRPKAEPKEGQRQPPPLSEEDQKRIMTPRQAIQAGADYLVIGRPIREAENPLGMVQSIIKEIS